MFFCLLFLMVVVQQGFAKVVAVVEGEPITDIDVKKELPAFLVDEQFAKKKSKGTIPLCFERAC